MYFWLAALWMGLAHSANFQPIPLQEAVAEALIEVKVVSDRDPGSLSSHYGQCIRLTAASTKKAPLLVSIAPGQQLVADDLFTQNMVITEEPLITLYPGDTQRVALFAMCGERSDGSPGAGDAFIVGEMAREEIREMAAYVYRKNYQHSTGQEAMWVVTDGADLENIRDENSFVANDLRQKAATLTDQPFVPYLPEKRTRGLSAIEGQFHYRVREQGFGTLQLFDPQGEVVKTIFERMPLTPGTYTFTVKAEGISLLQGTYKLILFINGQVRKEKSITL